MCLQFSSIKYENNKYEKSNNVAKRVYCKKKFLNIYHLFKYL